jgi:AAA domain/Bifunctional DNA primase/polymerase, N-terminal
MPEGPYASAAEFYLKAGYSPLPLPANRKFPPPEGWTGADARMASYADVFTWMQDHPQGNIALRLPRGVIGIDCDAWKGKAELAAWNALCNRLGPLPDAPCVSSRKDRISGIYLFRVPDDYVAADLGDAGEVIQHHHRYVVAYPSVHPSGGIYTWRNVKKGDDRLVVANLPELPPAWLEALQAGKGADGHASTWTDPDLNRLTAEGIPQNAQQDSVLRDVTWKLARAKVPRWVAYSMWNAIVSNTPLTRALEPWTDEDFDRHWQGAHGKVAHADLETREPDVDIHQFLAQKFPAEDWVIKRIIERSERLLVTGMEGYGKSQLLRQLAVCTASGVHPFTGKKMDKQRVVFLDCENTPRQSHRRFSELEEIAINQGHRTPEGNLLLFHRPQGLDLTRDADASWFMDLIIDRQPALLIIGPLYRLHLADVNEEPAARRVAAVLDEVRVTANCALVVEAHSPHASDGFKRSLRPIGSSLFLRWPEYGMALDGPIAEDKKDNRHGAKNLFNFVPWRGGRDRDRDWPRQLVWSQGLPAGCRGAWPWQAYEPDHHGRMIQDNVVEGKFGRGNPGLDRQISESDR